MGKKTIGIIGGMGPLATVELFHKLVVLTNAASDSEHIHILVDNFPQIPDRTAAILEGSDRPVSHIVEAGNRLIRAGAELLLIPCNTSHYYYDQIAAALSVPVLNMLQLTAVHLQKEGVKRVGLLATDGTIQTRVFANAFAGVGIETLCPDPSGQQMVMHMIYREIKAGKKADCRPIERVMDALRAQGAERIVLGCTELPLAFSPTMKSDMVDPAHLLALEAIRRAGYETVVTR